LCKQNSTCAIGARLALTDLRAAANYPDAPDIVRYSVTRALNAADEFDNYGARLSGAFIPPVTGNYTSISHRTIRASFTEHDENPATIATLTPIAREPVWSGRRTWVVKLAAVDVWPLRLHPARRRTSRQMST
jgi:hypothetical protein